MWVMMHAKQGYLNRDYSVLEQKGRVCHCIIFLSWLYYCLVLSWCWFWHVFAEFWHRLHWLKTLGLMLSSVVVGCSSLWWYWGKSSPSSLLFQLVFVLKCFSVQISSVVFDRLQKLLLRYGGLTIDNFMDHCYSRYLPAQLEWLPFKFFDHFCGAAVPAVVIHYETGSPTLDGFNLLD